MQEITQGGKYVEVQTIISAFFLRVLLAKKMKICCTEPLHQVEEEVVVTGSE